MKRVFIEKAAEATGWNVTIDKRDKKEGGGYDIAFIARNTIADAKCADVQRSIETALTRAGIAGRP